MNELELAGIVVEAVGVLPMARYLYLVQMGHRHDKPGTAFDGEDVFWAVVAGVFWSVILVVMFIIFSVTWQKGKGKK